MQDAWLCADVQLPIEAVPHYEAALEIVRRLGVRCARIRTLVPWTVPAALRANSNDSIASGLPPGQARPVTCRVQCALLF
jgi:hypothetical protein